MTIKISEQDFARALSETWNHGYDQAIEVLQLFSNNLKEENEGVGVELVVQLIRLLEAMHPRKDEIVPFGLRVH